MNLLRIFFSHELISRILRRAQMRKAIKERIKLIYNAFYIRVIAGGFLQFHFSNTRMYSATTDSRSAERIFASQAYDIRG